MEAPKPDIKFLLAKGWKIRIGADTQTMRLVVKVGHPQLQQHAAVSYTVQEVAREGIEIDITDMMDVAMGIRDGHTLKR